MTKSSHIVMAFGVAGLIGAAVAISLIYLIVFGLMLNDFGSTNRFGKFVILVGLPICFGLAAAFWAWLIVVWQLRRNGTVAFGRREGAWVGFLQFLTIALSVQMIFWGDKEFFLYLLLSFVLVGWWLIGIGALVGGAIARDEKLELPEPLQRLL